MRHIEKYGLIFSFLMAVFVAPSVGATSARVADNLNSAQ